jgi:allantoinase
VKVRMAVDSEMTHRREMGDLTPVIAEGFDADIALVDPAHTWMIRAKDSPSMQGYTPFEGIELSARVDATFLRGMKIYEDGQVLGKPQGQYLHRPTA